MKSCLILLSAWCLLSGGASAQGLLLTLPEDGHWVRYEGTYTQVIRRPDSTQGDLKLQWTRFLTIKSVGREEAEYEGKVQPCRWIEIKSEVGHTKEGVLEAGPGGVCLFKILVPESALKGDRFETIEGAEPILISFTPIIKGLKRIGEEPPQEMPAGVFQSYPIVSLVRYYREIEEAGAAASLHVPAGDFESTPYKGAMVMETATYRSSNSAEFSRSPTMPFGLVKWTASTIDETKGSTDLRATFKESITLSEEMQAVQIGEGAQSEFVGN
jgi:hypothetical protein